MVFIAQSKSKDPSSTASDSEEYSSGKLLFLDRVHIQLT